jgi:hypothetical protein
MSKEIENKSETQTNPQPKIFPATVVNINDEYTVVINRGSTHGIKKGQNFLIYGVSKEEIIDPETGESLGYLETVRGTGTVIHVQEKLATIETNRRSKTKRTITRKPNWIYNEVETIEGEGSYVAFEDPELGDKARPI